MTTADLLQRVADLLREAVADLRLGPADGGEPRAPVVIEGWLAPPRSSEAQRPPLVVVRATKGTDTEDGAQTTIGVAVEVFDEGPAGWRDALTVLQRCRTAILQTGHLGPHVRELPVSWELVEEQPAPLWLGLLSSTWLSPRADYFGATE